MIDENAEERVEGPDDLELALQKRAIDIVNALSPDGKYVNTPEHVDYAIKAYLAYKNRRLGKHVKYAKYFLASFLSLSLGLVIGLMF